MRLFYPGRFALPTLVALGTALTLMSQFDIIRFTHFMPFREFWPLALIASGLEELYFWAATEKEQ